MHHKFVIHFRRFFNTIHQIHNGGTLVKRLGRVHVNKAGEDRLRTKTKAKDGFHAVFLVISSRNISLARKRFLASDDCYWDPWFSNSRYGLQVIVANSAKKGENYRLKTVSTMWAYISITFQNCYLFVVFSCLKTSP